jgi:hypothetical protein
MMMCRSDSMPRSACVWRACVRHDYSGDAQQAKWCARVWRVVCMKVYLLLLRVGKLRANVLFGLTDILVEHL